MSFYIQEWADRLESAMQALSSERHRAADLESKLQRGRQESNERLRQTLANILIEHAHLQRACNRMSRDAIVGGAEDNNPADSSTNYQPPTEDMVSLI